MPRRLNASSDSHPTGSTGAVVLLPVRACEPSHERVVHAELARRLAGLLGLEYAGDFDPSGDYPPRLYFVPSDTLSAADAPARLGRESDLFGGLVPYPFVATKAITHPLVAPQAAAPPGWSQAFPQRVAGDVLQGISVFSLEDARRAGRQLLERGPLRLKSVKATAGRGQWVVEGLDALDASVEALAPQELARHGLVLEENLAEVKTRSVGQVRVGALVASYYGTQRLTRDNAGELIYGGSDLVVVRGDFATLARLDIPADLRLAIAQACNYDAAAEACFPGFQVSRRNYDIAQGLDRDGRLRSGVLEQSWRIGGASSAEIGALQAFQADPSLQVVRAASYEWFGASMAVPEGAQVLYQAEDPVLGPMTKCMKVEPL
jgi:hypothetical protein